MTKYLLIAALGLTLGCSSSLAPAPQTYTDGPVGIGVDGVDGVDGGVGASGEGDMAGAGGEGGTGDTVDEPCPDGHKPHPLLGCPGPPPKTPVGDE